MEHVGYLPDLAELAQIFASSEEIKIRGVFLGVLHCTEHIMLDSRKKVQAWAAEFWHSVLRFGVCDHLELGIDELESRYEPYITKVLESAAFNKKWENGTRPVVGNWGTQFFHLLHDDGINLPHKPSVEFCEDLGKISQKHTMEMFASQLRTIRQDDWEAGRILSAQGIWNAEVGQDDLRRYVIRYIDANTSQQREESISPAMLASYTAQLGADTPSVFHDGVSEPDSSLDTSSIDTTSGLSCVPAVQQLEALLSEISSGIGQHEAVVKITSVKQAAHKARQQAAEVLRIAEADVRGVPAWDLRGVIDKIATATAKEAVAAKTIKAMQDSHEEVTAHSDTVRRAMGDLGDNLIYKLLQTVANTWKDRRDRWSKVIDEFKTAQENAAKLTAKADELEFAAKRQAEVLKETVDKFAEQLKGAIVAATTE
ncbi:hypothetical protein BKA63DRAFT_573062 [Paraphoma chrysanthemicola]|nr:hypothetical protein BKA63DRAFT_573062 [Paraphoma chrysanthemicola]